MIRFTFCIGDWVIFHIILFAKQEKQQEIEKVDLTGIGGDNIAPDEETEELATKHQFGFGR